MFSVIAHLTSLVFVVWTAYCVWLLIARPVREGVMDDWWIGQIWVFLAAATCSFFLLR